MNRPNKISLLSNPLFDDENFNSQILATFKYINNEMRMQVEEEEAVKTKIHKRRKEMKRFFNLDQDFIQVFNCSLDTGTIRHSGHLYLIEASLLFNSAFKKKCILLKDIVSIQKNKSYIMMRMGLVFFLQNNKKIVLKSFKLRDEFIQLLQSQIKKLGLKEISIIDIELQNENENSECNEDVENLNEKPKSLKLKRSANSKLKNSFNSLKNEKMKNEVEESNHREFFSFPVLNTNFFNFGKNEKEKNSGQPVFNSMKNSDNTPVKKRLDSSSSDSSDQESIDEIKEREISAKLKHFLIYGQYPVVSGEEEVSEMNSQKNEDLKTDSSFAFHTPTGTYPQVSPDESKSINEFDHKIHRRSKSSTYKQNLKDEDNENLELLLLKTKKEKVSKIKSLDKKPFASKKSSNSLKLDLNTEPINLEQEKTFPTNLKKPHKLNRSHSRKHSKKSVNKVSYAKQEENRFSKLLRSISNSILFDSMKSLIWKTTIFTFFLNLLIIFKSLLYAQIRHFYITFIIFESIGICFVGTISSVIAQGTTFLVFPILRKKMATVFNSNFNLFSDHILPFSLLFLLNNLLFIVSYYYYLLFLNNLYTNSTNESLSQIIFNYDNYISYIFLASVGSHYILHNN